ncbi:hypothetical protein [Streptomyces mutabilis]|uniref:hypothetical protein n=1 Tax=Streptomyces mutabilis TaxID=67332 RepID=UPI00342B68B3
MTTRAADPVVFGPDYIPRIPFEPYQDYGNGLGSWELTKARCTACGRRVLARERMSAHAPLRCGPCCDSEEAAS